METHRHPTGNILSALNRRSLPEPIAGQFADARFGSADPDAKPAAAVVAISLAGAYGRRMRLRRAPKKSRHTTGTSGAKTPQ
jgi:hypothetical protein